MISAQVVCGQPAHVLGRSRGTIQVGLPTYAWAHIAKPAALNRLVKFELAAPVRFITKGVVAKDLLPLFHHLRV